MNGISVGMAIVDFIPVLLFFISAVALQRDLYNKMVKGSFALLACGSILVLIAGFYKALWKILYALNVCDFIALDAAFFPMQAPGFALVFLGLLSMLIRKPGAPVAAAAVAPFESNMPFIAGQVIGCGGFQWCLFAIAARMHKPLAMAMFALAFVAMLGMGYLSAKFDDSSAMHWIAQLVNIVSNGALLAGVAILHKAGLGEPGSLDRGKQA